MFFLGMLAGCLLTLTVQRYWQKIKPYAFWIKKEAKRAEDEIANEQKGDS